VFSQEIFIVFGLFFRLWCYGNAQNQNGKQMLDTGYPILAAGIWSLVAGAWVTSIFPVTPEQLKG